MTVSVAKLIVQYIQILTLLQNSDVLTFYYLFDFINLLKKKQVPEQQILKHSPAQIFMITKMSVTSKQPLPNVDIKDHDI